MAKKQSNADRIYLELKQNLSSGQPFRKELITEQSLADQYGVSRTPVREALTKLCSEGLLEKHRSKGYLVKNIDNALLRAQAEYRGFLEVGALQKTIRNATDKEIQEVYSTLDTPIQTRDDFVAANSLFHVTLVSLAGNDSATQTVKELSQNVQHTLVILGPLSWQVNLLRTSHEAILDAVLARNYEAAAKLLMQDICSDLV